MKIAIIGSGGAGIAAAWLLDEQHDVTLYEREPTLGGHAHTVAVERDGATYHIDDGFSWFSDALYPSFLRLLEVLGVATRIIPMSLAVLRRHRSSTHVLPPTRLGALARTVADVPWLIDLLRFNRVIDRTVPIVRGGDRTLSLGAFIERHGYREPFVSEVLRPILGGIWGAPYSRVDDLAIYTIAKYLVFHRPSGLTRYPWHVVRGGAASYIEAVASGLRGQILRGAAVTHLERLAGGGWTVVDGRGERRTFDHVVLAAGARDAARILADVPGLDATRQVLASFEYYTVRIATHGDRWFMPANPRDWCVANLNWDGRLANLTVWSGLPDNAPIFTSYVGEREPERVDHVSTFHLPLPTPNHYRAQGRLAGRQGADGLSFAGDWTHDFGSHEDAIVSAMNVCQRLSPSASRLAALRAPRMTPAMQPLPARARASTEWEQACSDR